MIATKQWGVMRRKHWAEHVRLPTDFQIVKDHLAALMDGVPEQNPARIDHPPHAQARPPLCGETECLGYGERENTASTNYGVKLFGH